MNYFHIKTERGRAVLPGLVVMSVTNRRLDMPLPSDSSSPCQKRDRKLSLKNRTLKLEKNGLPILSLF